MKKIQNRDIWVTASLNLGSISHVFEYSSLFISPQCDLVQRAVSADIIDSFSSANGFFTWMETSVKENTNIAEAMR